MMQVGQELDSPISALYRDEVAVIARLGRAQPELQAPQVPVAGPPEA